MSNPFSKVLREDSAPGTVVLAFNGQEPGGSFNARVDAQTGEILSMDTWKPLHTAHPAQVGGREILSMDTWKPERRLEPGLRIPAVSEAQARQAAEALLKRLIPEHLPDLSRSAPGRWR